MNAIVKNNLYAERQEVITVQVSSNNGENSAMRTAVAAMINDELCTRMPLARVQILANREDYRSARNRLLDGDYDFAGSVAIADGTREGDSVLMTTQRWDMPETWESKDKVYERVPFVLKDTAGKLSTVFSGHERVDDKPLVGKLPPFIKKLNFSMAQANQLTGFAGSTTVAVDGDWLEGMAGSDFSYELRPELGNIHCEEIRLKSTFTFVDMLNRGRGTDNMLVVEDGNPPLVEINFIINLFLDLDLGVYSMAITNLPVFGNKGLHTPSMKLESIEIAT